ncbi:MAG: beta-galactosidase [Candidatus Hydrogenedentes bacterium]|nr:beta-galactosidase [Candidatus Hydrogenedentota bacterium]
MGAISPVPTAFRRCAVALFLTFFAAPTHAQITSGVGEAGGAPVLMINGAAHPGASYMTYVGVGDPAKPSAQLTRYVNGFGGAGCDFFTFVIDLGGLYGYTPTVWPEPDRFDFTYLDASARAVLAAGGPEAKLMIQLYMDTPAWWSAQHPEELLRLSNGETTFGEKLFALPRPGELPSIASDVWRADMKRVIEVLIDHVAQSDYGARVIGYQVTGQKTQEWYHWSMNTPELGDYSAPMVKAWRGWLRARYGTDEALHAAWHQPDATLDTAAIPTKEERYGAADATFRDPVKEAHVIDFHRFWSDIMADTIAYFAGVVKEKTGHTKVVGGFYAYSFEFAELAEDAGHLALGRLMECPDLDFIMAPASYHRRNLKGGQSCFRAPLLSLRQHGKLFWNDFDPASFKILDKDKAALAPWIDVLAVTDTAEEFTWMMGRELGNALANGVNMAWFDLHGGYYDDPTILAHVAKQRKIREAALGRDRRSTAQILVVFDEDSMHYLKFRDPLVRKVLIEQLAELPFVAPYDSMLLSDLGRVDPAQYKLVIMANTFKLDRPQRDVLSQTILRDGRTVLWLYAPGYFAEPGTPGSAAAMEALTGIPIVSVTADQVVAAPLLASGASVEIPPMQGQQFAAQAADGTVAVVGNAGREGWRSVYSSRVPLPATYLREIASAAGVHLYSDNPKDQVYASGAWLTLAASGDAGPRTIRLRTPATVRDAYTGAEIATGASEFTADFKPWEVRLFELE